MGPADDGAPADVEFLDVGPKPRSPAAGGPTRRWRRWLPLLLTGVVAAVVVTFVVHGSSKPSASSTTKHSTTAPAAPAGSAPAVTVTRLGHPILGVTAGWELFARGDRTMVRIQLARGRITRTTVPALSSSGPVSFVVGAGEAIVRPIDIVPGYVVPDGRPARLMSARLTQSGPAFPGPDPEHVWVQRGDNSRATMVLAALDGSGHGATIRVPAGGSSIEASSDGTGGLLFPGLDGVYDVRPGRTSRVTTGALLAAGPTRWLTAECDRQAHCSAIVIDRTDGSRHVLPIPVGADTPVSPGVISPDGSLAASIATGPGPAAHLIDLRTGTEHALPVPVDLTVVSLDESLVWSPDSRWLFCIDANGHLDAINPRTGRISDLAGPLPKLSQLAIRAAG